MLGKVFKAYDVRATYPKPLNEKLAWKIGLGAAQFMAEQASDAGYDDPMMRHVVVGRDMRKSSPDLSDALMQGIRDGGYHVIDVGLVDTPFVYFAINYLGCCGGIQTTASHNPANYNGFKISKMGAKPVGMTTGLDDVRRYAALVDPAKYKPRGGRLEARDLWGPYRDHVLKFVDPAVLSGDKKVKVVIDASNGMAGTMVPKVFADIPGLEIIEINFDNSSGEFVHEPNPLVEANLEQVREGVVKAKADFGVCFDGDADRCMVVDEKGGIIGCDLLTAWLAKGFLKSDSGAAIVYDLRSSKSLPEIVEENGGVPIKSRVGHVFMKQVMREQNAVFGGELSGHFYFRENFNADSGAIAFASVISGVANSKQPLSKLIKPARRYSQSGEINFENEDKEGAIEALKDAFPNAKIEELDGVSLEADGWWCNVRMSNTEPLLRLNLETTDDDMVEACVDQVSSYLGERVDH